MEYAASSYHNFGELLKVLRKSRRLTQQQLADTAGVHRQTIANYEGGRDPQNRHLVLELAKALRLNEQETNQLLEASFTTPTPHWVVPYPRNPYFTGRTEILTTLHPLLVHEGKVATTSFALSGLGGIGKTQLALEYAYRHALDYSAVFWINAETPESILASYGAIAESLLLPEYQETDQQLHKAAVQRWLNAHSGWLLIWDNLEDLALVSPFLATLQGSHLITTRQTSLGTLAQSLELHSLPAEEALLFLFRRAKRLPPDATLKQLATLAQQEPAEHKAAKALVRLLDGLPLALDQAGALIEEANCSIADYLRLYRAQRGELLARRGTSESHPQSVLATLALASQRLEQNQIAIALLRLCAFLAPDAIPVDLLIAGGAALGEQLATAVNSPLALDEACVALRRLSLIQRQPKTGTISLHRLVQAVQQDQLAGVEQRQWAERTVRLIASAWPDSNDFATWEQCRQLLPHALVCAGHIGRWDFTFPEAASLLNDAGHYLRQRVQLKEALPLLERAVQIRERTLGLDHPDTATSINNLAAVYWVLGHFQRALALFQQALAIREGILEPLHPDIGRSLNNVAHLHRELGQISEALPLFQRALSIFERIFDPDHPALATTLNNLADLFVIQAQLAEAEPRYQQALAIRERALGQNHPDVATSLRNLAEMYVVQQKYDQALALHQRALRIREQALGAHHPDTAQSIASVANIITNQGKYKEALALHHQAWKIREKAFGQEHPDTAESLSSIAHIHFKLGQFDEAKRLYQEALMIYEQLLGPEHTVVAETQVALAAIHEQLGNQVEALALYQQALILQEAQLGSEHSKTVQTRAHLREVRARVPIRSQHSHAS